MTYFDTTYFEDHHYLLEVSTLLEPKTQYSFDYTFQSINTEIANFKSWNEFFDGPKPTAKIDCTPYKWYTQQWWNCAKSHQPADFNEDELFHLFDYHFTDDETIYTGDFLDDY